MNFLGRVLLGFRLISINPDGDSPIWEMARTGASVDIQVAKNKDWKPEKLYPYKAVAITDRENKVDIGLISPKGSNQAC